MSKKVIVLLSLIIIAIIALIIDLLLPDKQCKVQFSYDNGQITEIVLDKGNLVTKPEELIIEGYKFIGWKLNGEPFDFQTPITEDILLVAVYEKINEENLAEYTVIFEEEDGATIGTLRVKEGELVDKPETPTKKGYIFVGWKLNGELYDFTKEVTENITLVAVWREAETEKETEKVTVTFNVDGGSTVKSQTLEKGNTLTKPSNPTKSGYTFVEWTLNGEKYNFTKPVTDNITLKAIWEKVETVTVTFNTDGGSSVKTQVVEKGNKVTKPSNPTKSGYRFKGWKLNGNNYNFDGAVNSDITLKASWEKIETVTVTFDTDGGNSVATQTIEKGKNASEPKNPIKNGYIFKGWTLNGSKYNFGDAVNSNITLKASWEKIEPVTVTFDTDGGGNIAVQTVEKGKRATRPTDPIKAGYTFIGWTLNGATYNFEDAVNSNITLKANWKQKTYTAKITKVDEYSTDRYITVLEEGNEIPVSGIFYTNGKKIPAAISGNKLSVSVVDVTGITTIKVKLKSGSMVTATIQ